MKGNLVNIALAVILTMVILFIGVWAMSFIGAIFSPSDLSDYAFTTNLSSGTDDINVTDNATRTHILGEFASISGEAAPTRALTVLVGNANDTVFNITTYLNGVSIGLFAAANETNTTYTYQALTFVASATNNLTFETAHENQDLTLYDTTVTYPTSTVSSNYGTMYNNIVTSTGTTFDVMLLVILLFALGVAIAALRGMGGAGGSGSPTT